MESTINVPFKFKADDSREHPGVPFCFIDHTHVEGSYYGPISKGKEKMRARLVEQIEEGLRARKNPGGRAIGTGDGSVFLVRFAFDGWQYSITGPGRTYAGSTSGFADITEATERAASILLILSVVLRGSARSRRMRQAR